MIRMSTLMLQSPNWPNPTKIEGGAASGPAEESAQKTPADFPSGLSPLCTSKSEYSTRLVDDSSEGHVNRGLARSAQSERPGDHTSPALKRMSTLMLQSPNWPNPTKIEGGAASGPAEESAQKTPAGTSVYGQNPLYAGLEDGLSCTDDESNGDSDLGNAGSSLSQDLDVPEKTESLLARVRRLLASVYYFFQVKHAPRSSDAALLPKAAGLVGAPADLAESTSKPVTVTEEAAPPTAAVRAEEASSEEARGIMPPVSLQSKQKPTVPQMRTWQLTWKTQGPEWLEEGASGKKSVNVVSLHAMSKLAAKVVEEKQPLRQLQIAVEARSGDKRQGEEKEELAKLLGAIPVKLLEAIDKERPSLNTPSRAVDDLDEEGALDWQK
eukprot:gene23348-28254_t